MSVAMKRLGICTEASHLTLCPARMGRSSRPPSPAARRQHSLGVIDAGLSPRKGESSATPSAVGATRRPRARARCDQSNDYRPLDRHHRCRSKQICALLQKHAIYLRTIRRLPERLGPGGLWHECLSNSIDQKTLGVQRFLRPPSAHYQVRPQPRELRLQSINGLVIFVVQVDATYQV